MYVNNWLYKNYLIINFHYDFMEKALKVVNFVSSGFPDSSIPNNAHYFLGLHWIISAPVHATKCIRRIELSPLNFWYNLNQNERRSAIV